MIKFILIPFVVFLVGIGVIGVYLSPDDLAKCDPSPSAKDGCLKADAIAVVSGGNTDLRTAEAIRLFEAGWANYLIVSGAAADPTSPSNAALSTIRCPMIQIGHFCGGFHPVDGGFR